ncbi:MAG: glycosyltransferase [Candidatus Binatia bacterium]
MRLLKAFLFTHRRKAAEAQVYPFFKHRAELEEKLRFVFDDINIADARQITTDLYAGHCDVVFIQDSCFTGLTSEERIDILRGVTGRARLVWLDSWDSTYANAKGFSVLPYVDLYIKKQIFRNVNLYKNQYLDGRIFSDYLIRKGNLKTAFTGSVIGHQAHRHKVVLGWNIGSREDLDREFCQQNYKAFANNERSTDVSCRVGTKKTPHREWYSYHRNSVLQKLIEMRGEYKIVAKASKRPWQEYLDELRTSRITVSPFGWGEICRRDFEAVICGSLLIKPSMEHLNTLPNIYVAEKTYVPVKWDLSDLREKCEYYLRNDVERERIVKNAEGQYGTYFRERLFIGQVEEILDRLKLR